MESQASPALDPGVAAGAPPRFHLLSKPSGSTCNIDCKYCFFLSKEALYPDDKHRMSQATLETYIQQLMESHRTPEVTVAWQGGEPTLMGVDYFRKSVDLVEKYRRPGQQVRHTFQTNGIALDDEWCGFFKANNFLVGLSVDGPRDLHDTYRVTRGGKGTFDLVMKGWQCLRKHGVDFNILCTVNAANQAHGRRVYQFFRDELGAAWIQFIPIVERATADTIQIANLGWSERPKEKRLLSSRPARSLPTARSRGQYGSPWSTSSRSGSATTSARSTYSSSTSRWRRTSDSTSCASTRRPADMGRRWSTTATCTRATTCRAPLQAGQHPRDAHARAGGFPRQRKFGLDKRDTLTRQCQQCQARPLCNGRTEGPVRTLKDGEPGHNYLCEGLYQFFTHAARRWNRWGGSIRPAVRRPR